MAPAFGWNGGCAVPSDECGKRDLLFGRTFDGQDVDGVWPVAGAGRSLWSTAD